MTMINIIQDMDLKDRVILADSTVIYHAIALIVEAVEAVEDAINVDKKVIMHVIVQIMVTEVTMEAVGNVLNVEIMGILPRIAMKIILIMNGVQLRKDVIRVERLDTCLVIVRDQEEEEEDMVVVVQNAIIVVNLDIWLKIVIVIVIVIARNAIVVANMDIFNEIVIRNRNAIIVVFPVIKVEIVIYHQILKFAIIVNRKGISKEIVPYLMSTRNHTV